MGNIKSGIARAINGFTTPEALTSQFIKNVCLSDYTLEAIRGLLINPVKSKFVPKVECSTYDDMMYNLFSLCELIGYKKVCNDLLSITDDDKIKRLEEGYKVDPEEAFYDNITRLGDITSGKGAPITKVISVKGAFLYIEFCKDTDNWKFCLNLYFVGPRAKEVYEEFISIKEKVTNWIDIESKSEDARKIKVMSMTSRGMWRTKSTTVPSTIIMDHVEGDIDEIIKMIDRSSTIADEYGINKTIGILLHGPHGTGKSTIARYLALILNRTLVLTTSDNLEEAIEKVQMTPSKKYIILIEDIDFMFTDRRSQVNPDGEDSGDKPKRTTRSATTTTSVMRQGNDDMNKRTSLLFQVLDGVLSNSNIMIIATTNYFDRLDPALIRDGRFDYKIELKGLDYDTAAKVCEKFDVTPEEIDLKNWKLPIAPATLQTVLLKYKITNVNTYDPNRVDNTSGEN